MKTTLTTTQRLDAHETLKHVGIDVSKYTDEMIVQTLIDFHK